ncbi:hypothetical protein C8C85_1229 [Flavobacterium sp. 103]|uniref:hypothetical protein n=1 Tax=Flavobacterium sp. 103 TaxID=2135624 RepID=UPI000D5CBE05|nr:hypothetical protein [Flavobacterium sp. 103]PVX45436.1 hypothetical protein C8C85_1229 [Flavobacterium sp. 103]
MKNFKIILSFIFLASLFSCGKNEPEEKGEIETNYTQTSNITTATPDTKTENVGSNTETENTETEDTDNDSDSGLATAIQRQIPNSQISNESTQKNSNNQDQIVVTIATPTAEKAETIVNTPLRNLLRQAQVGKSYSKRELIEEYKFPKEAVDLIKHVTCVGPNKLYFNWGSTWLVEKVSDAEFENDTMIFTFKKNKTYVSGGAIGIKYNKKIYTELILNNGSAYIPSVKGYHWEINK